MATFITSQKGKRKLVLNSYIFRKEKTGADSKEIWSCETRGCNARLHTLHDAIVKGPTDHNHAPVHGKADVETVRIGMKRRAETTDEATRQITQQSLTQVSLSNAHLLPSTSTISRDIRRHRQTKGANVETLNEYRRTVSGADFLRVEEEDLLIFAAQGKSSLFSSIYFLESGFF